MNPSETTPSPAADNAQEIKFLNYIAIVAIIDVVLLIPLVWASRFFADKHEIVSILGPIHGIFFVILVGLCLFGSINKWWGWWFPVVVVITGGPIGSLIGDWIIRRDLKDKAA